VQLSVFAGYRFWYRKKVTFYPFLFIMLLFSVEAIRGMYLDARRIKLFNKEEYSWQYEDRFQKYAAGILKNERKRFPTEKIVLTGSSYYINHRVSLYSNLPILPDAQRINQLSSIQAKEPVLLLVILNKKDLPDYKTFLSSGREVVGQFNDFYFYTAYVQPN
jgi:hypothetical protein